MKASDLFLRCLEAEGVDRIFGVPGEENADVMISLLDSPIRFILCRHEQGAAFMADLYGRLTGRPGVCLGTLGPGAANLVTGVANAHFDRSPVVVLTGQAGTDRLHKESHQNMDVVGLFRPITKWSATVYRPDNIPEMVRKAFRLAAREKPGAVHLELPEDVAKQETGETPLPPGGRLRRSAPDHRSVRTAVELIRQAQRPILLAGNGCVRKRASAQVLRLVEQTGLMVTHTFMGKGVIPDSNKYSLFVAGLGSRDHVTTAFAAADLVIAVGYDMIEWHPDRWNRERDKTIIHIDFEPAEVDDHYVCDVELVCDIAEALWAINEEMARPENRVRFDVPLFHHLRDHYRAETGMVRPRPGDPKYHDVTGADLPFSDAYPLKPQRLLRDLRDLMGPRDILISDVGAHKMWTARHYPTEVPGTCLLSNGFCSMGIALPGAVSAKMICPDRKVAAVIGDGAFMMNVQELMTAVEHKVPAVLIVWEDGGYGLIGWKQFNAYRRTSHVGFLNPDFVRLAESFGAFGRRVTAAADLKPALEEAFAQRDRPSVVVVPVDYAENLRLTDRLGRLVPH